MKTSIGALLVLALIQPTSSLADRYGPSGAVVVGGGYHSPRPGYYGPRGAYYGPGWRPYGGPRVGVYFGAPLVWGWPWGAPAYYPPPLIYPSVVTVQPPVVYVEKGEANVPQLYGGGESLEPGYWYYCRESAAYYPAVNQCPSRWEKVAPISN